MSNPTADAQNGKQVSPQPHEAGGCSAVNTTQAIHPQEGLIEAVKVYECPDLYDGLIPRDDVIALIRQYQARCESVKRCPACNGNDGDMPCAYPREREARSGCLRNERLGEPVAVEQGVDVVASIRAAEEALYHHGYNPATNKDVARICFTAMHFSLRSTTQAAGRDEVMNALQSILPLELVQGDAIHRTNPRSQQVVNSSEAWLVSQGEKSSHKLRGVMNKINAIAIQQGDSHDQ